MNDVEALILHAVGLVVEQSMDVLGDLGEITTNPDIKSKVLFMNEMLDLVNLTINELTQDPTDEI